MNLNIEKVLFAVKIINLNIKVFIKKKLVAFVFKINSNNIYTAMISINQDIIVLFLIIILGSKI